MRSFPRVIALGILALLLSEVAASAAWNNVFQVNLFRRRRQTTSNYACCPQPVIARAAPCCPQPCCPQQYVQRSYYQPVTSYQQRCYYEPVTTYRTSYYYEPVTSYRYSCYYDPCTCSYQQIATPTTSYRLRQKCDPVTSYLQRTQMVPVTSYQLSYYYEPVNPCDTPRAPVLGEQPGTPQPRLGENPTNSDSFFRKPRLGEDPNGYDSFYRKPRETGPPPMSGAYDSSIRKPLPPSQPVAPAVQPEAPRVRLDRIVMLPSTGVAGQVVRGEELTPRAGARLLFVSTEQDGQPQTVTADENGRFQATLAKGSWLVYVRNGEGTPVFQKKIEVKDGETAPLQLTSR